MAGWRTSVGFWGAVLVFLATATVYAFTVTIDVPFWDSGEFIATSHILGIPHSPGTPLYVIIGKVFSLIPTFEKVATRVNFLSGVASALAAAFTFLVVLEFFRNWVRSSESKAPIWIGMVGGVVAAGFTAFGRTFWDNAIEAEVYALSNLIMILCFYFVQRWARPGDRSRRMGLFLLLYYIICLSMGIHLGTFLVLPGIILYALLIDRRLFGESVVGALLVAGTVVVLHPGMLPTLGPIYAGVFGLVLILCIITIAQEVSGGKVNFPVFGMRGLLTWCLIVSVLGISTHIFLLIRANSDVAINEADPSNLANLWKVLIRDQYKPPNPFTFRKAPIDIQFTRHFFDYARDQYDLGFEPKRFAWGIPYILGWVGLVGQAIRRRKDFALLFITYVVMSIGLVFYLNFREAEVRDRDYFFVASFQFYTIWIGLGCSHLLLEAWSVLKRAGGAVRTSVTAVLAVLFLWLPVARASDGWFSHDRTEFFVAADFAYNVLAPLEPDALIFTNGDNDTFPLWYVQEVEGLRKDIRVINLSLLNTDWYLRQLRDLEPKVDIGWDDEYTEIVAQFSAYSAGHYRGHIPRENFQAYLHNTGLRPYVRTLDAELLAKDVAVARIIEREYDRRPIYIALTVPDLMGLDNRLVHEGVVYRLDEPKGDDTRVAIDRSVELLTETFRYRGILTEDGQHDDSVYKDPNSTRLIQNYAAAHLTIARELLQRGRPDLGLDMAQRAEQISPHATAVKYTLGLMYRSIGDHEKMEEVFADLITAGNYDPGLYGYLGLAHELQADWGGAEAVYVEGLQRFPEDFELHRALFSLYWKDMGRKHDAVDVLETWLRNHPDDGAMRATVRAYRDSADVLEGDRGKSP